MSRQCKRYLDRSQYEGERGRESIFPSRVKLVFPGQLLRFWERKLLCFIGYEVNLYAEEEKVLEKKDEFRGRVRGKKYANRIIKGKVVREMKNKRKSHEDDINVSNNEKRMKIE